MWPFNRKPEKVEIEKPMPPCGNKEVHFHWVDDNWPCPICTSNNDKAKKRAEREDLAELIAEKVAAKLRKRR